MSAGIEFGVGCFAFEWREANETRSGDDWANDVTDALSSLANVSAIDVSGSPYFLKATEPEGDFGIQGYAHPHPVAATVRFDITIPRRHHPKELMPAGMTASENYRVVINYEYESPVAFVFPLDQRRDHGSASKGVMLVRKHLEEHVSDTSKVKFSSVGPSPFHAEFYLSGASKLDEVLECEITKARGYDDITFRYDESSFKDVAEAQEALLRELGQELSLFYFLLRMRNGRRRLAMEIAQEAQALVALHTEKGIKGRWRRLFQSGGQARHLALAVLDAELDAAWDAQGAESAVQSTYKGSDGFLRTYVDPLATDSLSPMIVNARNVVHQLESGRTKELEITLVTTATVGGALAGGLISAIVTLMGPS